jgi:hypothetical protein
VQLNAAGEKAAMLVQVPETGTLDVVGFKLGTVITPVDLKVSFQDLDANGIPDGTIDQFRVVPSAQVVSNAWITTASLTSDGTEGGTKRSITRGQWVAVVVEFDSATGNLNVLNESADGPAGGVASRFITGAWENVSFGVCVALRYTGQTNYTLIPGVYPVKSFNSTISFNSGSTPDEYALRFQIPFRCRLDAVRVLFDPDNPVDLVLYDASNNVVKTITVPTGVDQHTGLGYMDYLFVTRPTIEANTTYRMAVKPTTGSNVQILTLSVDSAAVMAAFPPGGGQWFLSTRTDGGSWTDTQTDRPLMSFVFSHLDDAVQVDFPGGLEIHLHNLFAQTSHAVGTGLLWKMNASGEKLWHLFQVPTTGTLDLVEVLFGGVSNAQDIKVSFQDVNLTTGLPDGSIDQFRVIPAASVVANTWVATGLMTSDGTDGGVKRSVTRGQWLAIVLEFDSTIGDVNVTPLTEVTAGVYAGTSYSGYAVSTIDPLHAACFAVKYSDGSYKHIPRVWPVSDTPSGVAFNSASTPDEYALRFQVPVPLRLDAYYLNCDPDQDCFITLYDQDDTVIEQISTNTTNNGQGGPGRLGTLADRQYFVFPGRPALAANTTYRVSIAPKATSPNVTEFRLTMPSVAVMAAMPGGAGWFLSTRTNGGAWTDVPTQRPMGGLRFASINGTPIEVEFVSGETEIGLSWSGLIRKPITAHEIGLSGAGLIPKSITALKELERYHGITVHQAGDFMIATVQEGDRSVARYVRVDQLVDPEAVKRRVLATQQKLRETTVVEMPPEGGERCRLTAAYHEAGHCVTALSLGLGIRRSSIIPGQYGEAFFIGETAYDLALPDPHPRLTLVRMAVSLRAGSLAPVVLLRHAYEQLGGADERQIDSILRVLDVGDPAGAWNALTAAVREFLYVPLHAAQVEAVACALLERRTMTGGDIRTVCAANGLPITNIRLGAAQHAGLDVCPAADSR